MLTNPYKDHIIINPLMRGGIIPQEVKARLPEFMEVGYIACFDCLEGRSSLLTKPNIKDFLVEVASFFGGDVAEHTFGCRGAQFAVMQTMAELAAENNDYCPTIIADPNCHYTTAITAEMNHLRVVEPPHSGYPEYRYDPASFAERIEEVKSKEGALPTLVVVTHADPYYGNIAPVEEIGQICEQYEVPYMVNVAYTGGVIPIDMRKIKADFLTVSAHKSMASLGPLGYLVTTYRWPKKLLATSRIKMPWTGRAFGKKIPRIFGCSIGGLPLISSMLAFSHVKERVNRWEEELAKIHRFIKDMEEIEGVMLLGERPHRHHLLHFETPRFWEVSKTHRKKGFYLAAGMIKRGIVGLHKGMTKHIKLSIYELSEDEIAKVKEGFNELSKAV